MFKKYHKYFKVILLKVHKFQKKNQNNTGISSTQVLVSGGHES